MDEKSLPDLLSNLISGASEETSSQDREDEKNVQNNLLLESLQALAAQSGGPLQAAVGEFLSGKGRLHATARSARSKKSAVEKVETFLTENLNVSPALAGLIAPLVVNLLPSLGGETSKPRRRRKTKPKTESTSSAKKPKKKPAAKPKPSASTKPASSKPKPKPKKKPSKSAKKTDKKESKPKAKPKKSTRTPSGDILNNPAPPLD
jgi:hypothetical protein